MEAIMYDNGQLRGYAAEFEMRTQRAEKASRKWEERKAFLHEYMKANAHNYQTEKQRRDKYTNDWVLNDAMDTWNWNRREANRIAQLILAEKALREMAGAL